MRDVGVVYRSLKSGDHDPSTPESQESPESPREQSRLDAEGTAESSALLTPDSKQQNRSQSSPRPPSVKKTKRNGRRLPYFVEGQTVQYQKRPKRRTKAADTESLTRLWDIYFRDTLDVSATEFLFIEKMKDVISKKRQRVREWLTPDPMYVIQQMGDECYLTSVFQAVTSIEEFEKHFNTQMKKMVASLTKGSNPGVNDLVETNGVTRKVVFHKDIRNFLIDMMYAYQYQTTIGPKLPKSTFDNGYAHRLLFAFIRLGYLTRVSFCSVPSWIIPKHHILPGFIHIQILLLEDSNDTNKPIEIKAYDDSFDPLAEAKFILPAEDSVLSPVEFCQMLNEKNAETRLLGGIVGLTPGYDDVKEDWAHYVTFRVEYGTSRVIKSVTWFDTNHPVPLESFSAAHLRQLGGSFFYEGEKKKLTLSDASRPCHVDEMILFYSIPDNP